LPPRKVYTPLTYLRQVPSWQYLRVRDSVRVKISVRVRVKVRVKVEEKRRDREER
jgi:hypothetical protein